MPDDLRNLALSTIGLLYTRDLMPYEVQKAIDAAGIQRGYDRDRDPYLHELFIYSGIHGAPLAILLEELTLALVRKGKGPVEWWQQPPHKCLSRAFTVLGLDVLERLRSTILHARDARYPDPIAPIPDAHPLRSRLDRVCFVVMPFGEPGTQHREHWDGVYRELIRPAVEDAGGPWPLEPYRADEATLPGTITMEIVECLALARLVIADVSDHTRANVWYELGIRHSLNSPTILIRDAVAEGGPPFDTHDARYIDYSYPGTTPTGNEFKRRMKAAIRDALGSPDQPDSVVARTLASHPDFWQKAEYDGPPPPEFGLLNRERYRAGRECEHMLAAIWEGFRMHAADYDGRWPRVENWRRMIVPYIKHIKYVSRPTAPPKCPAAEQEGYTMNAHLSTRKELAVINPGRVPLVFDSTLEQDSSGGRPGMGRHPRGNNILFADGTVRTLQPEYNHRLQWHPDGPDVDSSG